MRENVDVIFLMGGPNFERVYFFIFRAIYGSVSSRTWKDFSIWILRLAVLIGCLLYEIYLHHENRSGL